jgi:sodium/potassium/calcium exchanger 6
MYYCTIQEKFCSKGKLYVFFPLSILFLVIAMFNLGSTADSYLSPSLEAISEKLSCSESLAGVTLLALGNGAPDVFSAIAAGGDSAENGDIMLSVSALIGSSFFITTFVMFLAVNASPN